MAMVFFAISKVQNITWASFGSSSIWPFVDSLEAVVNDLVPEA